MPVGGLPLSLFQVSKIRFFMTYCNIIKAMVTRQSILDIIVLAIMVTHCDYLLYGTHLFFKNTFKIPAPSECAKQTAD